MELAIKDAGIDPKDVNYINAHGTSTGLNVTKMKHWLLKNCSAIMLKISLLTLQNP